MREHDCSRQMYFGTLWSYGTCIMVYLSITRFVPVSMTHTSLETPDQSLTFHRCFDLSIWNFKRHQKLGYEPSFFRWFVLQAECQRREAILNPSLIVTLNPQDRWFPEILWQYFVLYFEIYMLEGGEGGEGPGSGRQGRESMVKINICAELRRVRCSAPPIQHKLDGTVITTSVWQNGTTRTRYVATKYLQPIHSTPYSK